MDDYRLPNDDQPPPPPPPAQPVQPRQRPQRQEREPDARHTLSSEFLHLPNGDDGPTHYTFLFNVIDTPPSEPTVTMHEATYVEPAPAPPSPVDDRGEDEEDEGEHVYGEHGHDQRALEEQEQEHDQRAHEEQEQEHNHDDDDDRTEDDERNHHDAEHEHEAHERHEQDDSETEDDNEGSDGHDSDVRSTTPQPRKTSRTIKPKMFEDMHLFTVRRRGRGTGRGRGSRGGVRGGRGAGKVERKPVAAPVDTLSTTEPSPVTIKIRAPSTVDKQTPTSPRRRRAPAALANLPLATAAAPKPRRRLLLPDGTAPPRRRRKAVQVIVSATTSSPPAAAPKDETSPTGVDRFAMECLPVSAGSSSEPSSARAVLDVPLKLDAAAAEPSSLPRSDVENDAAAAAPAMRGRRRRRAAPASPPAMFSPTAVATPPSAGNTMTASSVNRDKMDRTDLALMSYLELPQFSAKEMVQMAPYLEKTDPSQPTSTANMVRRIKFSALQAKADERRRVEAAMALGTGNGDVGTADESIAPDLRALRLIISGSSASNAASPASALAEGGLEDDNDSAKGSGGSRKRRARASLAGSNAKLRFSTGSLTGGDPASPSVSSDDFAGLSSSAGLAGTLAVAAASASAITSSAPEDKPKTHVNHDHCESCCGTGVLICCDTCPLSYHYFCTDPPLDPERLPEGDWHCVKCQTQRNKVVMPNRARSEAGTILRLIDVANTSNPTTYALPKALQNYFEGVGADAITGAYVDKVMRRTVMDPSLVNQLSDGARCHGCGKAASDSVSAIECSFCPLVWHHDCMDPPMVQAPPLHHKWICPVHAEALLPRKRIRRRGRAALYILRPQLPPSYYAAAAAAAANVEDGSEDECNGEVVDLASSLIPTEAAHIAIELESSRPPGRHVVAEQAIKLDFVRGSTRRADEEQVVHDVVLVRVPDEVVECYASARKPVHTDERDVAAFLESIVKLQEDAAAQVVRSQRQARETLLDELLSEDTRIGRLFGQLPLPDLKRLAKGEPVSEIAQDMMRQAPPTAELYRDEPLLLRFAAWNWYQSAKEQVRLTRTAAAALT